MIGQNSINQHFVLLIVFTIEVIGLHHVLAFSICSHELSDGSRVCNIDTRNKEANPEGLALVSRKFSLLQYLSLSISLLTLLPYFFS
jgi:hypothetical protein